MVMRTVNNKKKNAFSIKFDYTLYRYRYIVKELFQSINTILYALSYYFYTLYIWKKLFF